MKAPQEDVVRLRRLWDEHIHRPFPATGNQSGLDLTAALRADDPRVQEVALYSSWLGSMVEHALQRGHLDPKHAEMLKTRRKEGNQALFRAGGELGEPMRSYVARLITMEELLSSLPFQGQTGAESQLPALRGVNKSRRLPARRGGPGEARGGDVE